MMLPFLIVQLLSLLSLAVSQGTVQLERLLLDLKCPNGSEMSLQHDNRDTRMYLSSPSTLEPEASFQMIIHSRDNTLLRVDIVKWNAKGLAEDHYDISDLKRPMINEATKHLISSLESLSPDLFFLLKEIKAEGLRRTTRVRRGLPDKVRQMFPSLPTVYERIIYSALSPFFEKINQRIPKYFELFPKQKPQEWQKKDQERRRKPREPKHFEFDFAGQDKFGRPSRMVASFGIDGMKMEIETHLPSIVDLYNDDSYL